MAADLYIHVFEGVTEADLAAFNGNVLGSKWFNEDFSKPQEWDEALHMRIHETPKVWIGEVSWLKAAMLDDSETYIPSPVQAVFDLVGEELPVLDEDLLGKLLAALVLSNSMDYTVATPDEVGVFLWSHLGKRLFTVSW